MHGFASVQTHKTPQRWLRPLWIQCVFRMSTFLWSLPVLQHGTLKQQPQFLFFFFQVSRSFKNAIVTQRLWDIPQRGDHSWSSNESKARDAESGEFTAPSVSGAVCAPMQVTPWKPDSLCLQFKSSSQPQTLSCPPSLERCRLKTVHSCEWNMR